MLKTTEATEDKNLIPQIENKHQNDIPKPNNVHTLNANEINIPFESRVCQTKRKSMIQLYNDYKKHTLNINTQTG